MGKKVLILFPDGWRIEECCVKLGSTIAPTAPLNLAAYLRKQGHHPIAAPHPVTGPRSFKMGTAPDALVIYAPWHSFSNTTAPMIQAVKKEYPACITIMVMYETFSGFVENSPGFVYPGTITNEIFVDIESRENP